MKKPKTKRKGSTTRRISAALTKYLRKVNPAFKLARAARVKVNRSTGAITFIPIKGLGKR